MDIVFSILDFAITACFVVIIATVTVSWLVAFDVLNTRNKWVWKACDLLNCITNPVVLPLRKIIPPLGGIDITPMVIIFGLMGAEKLLEQLRLHFGG